jgi:brefeldin A-resistance guanine nucleotide exchange factor 1
VLIKIQVEAVPESLKNVLLVMASGGFLIRPEECAEDEGGKMELWTQTWKRLERFLPDLKEELFPPMPEKKEPGAVVEEKEAKEEATIESATAADDVNAGID